MDYKRVGMQIGLAVFVAAASWTVGPNVAEAAPVKPIVSTASFKANLEKSFLVADDTDDLSTRITTDRLNVRSGPSTGHNILGVLDTGTTVKGELQGDWFRITYNGQTAYLHADWLRSAQTPARSESAPAPAAETVTRYTTANLNVRAGQGTHTNILGVLPNGTKIEGAAVGEWFRISYSGQTAYVHTDYLRAAETVTQETERVSTEETLVTTAYLNVRTGPSTQYGILGVLNPGTKVEGSSEDGWFKLSYAGRTAYVSKTYLTAFTQQTESTPAAAEENRTSVTRYATAAVNVRTGPGTGYAILGVLPVANDNTAWGLSCTKDTASSAAALLISS
jgi:uncharacterized protein YraI